MIVNYFKSNRFIAFVILCFSVQIAFAQEDKYNMNDGKLRVFLKDFDQYKFSDDSCIFYIYEKEEITKRFNFSEILSNTSEEQFFIEFYISAGNYTVLIENLIQVPILFVNVNIKRKLMNYFPININELLNSKSSNSILVKDYAENYKRFKEINPY